MTPTPGIPIDGASGAGLHAVQAPAVAHPHRAGPRGDFPGEQAPAIADQDARLQEAGPRGAQPALT